MYKYLLEIKKKELKEEKEEYDSIITQQNDISIKIITIEAREIIKHDLDWHISEKRIIIGMLVVILFIAAPLNCCNIVATGAINETIINSIQLISNAIMLVIFGEGAISIVKNSKDIRSEKQQLQKMEIPKESKDELEQKKLELEKQLKNIRKSIAKTLEQIEFLQELEKHPIVLANNQEEFLKITETVEKGNLILENMKGERIDYKNIELKPNDTKQDIHRNCGKKLVKVYK